MSQQLAFTWVDGVIVPVDWVLLLSFICFLSFGFFKPQLSLCKGQIPTLDPFLWASAFEKLSL